MKIETKNLSKSFSDKKVLQDISFSASSGESLAIIGQSGVGKSVLLKCILGLVKPDLGKVLFNDKELTGKNRLNFLSTFGMLFQGAALFDSLSVWENITFRHKYEGRMSSQDRKELAIEKLKLVGLSAELVHLTPAELSGGMQKRVGLARAIASEPKILFFDEPTAGLDPIMAQTINHLIRAIVAKLGATAITISHDINSIRSVADRVIMLHEGNIKWEGTIKDFGLSSHPLITQFISASSTIIKKSI